MKLDTERDGLEAIFKPYQIKTLEILLRTPHEMGSGEVYRKLLSEGVDISRASVIFFLNDLVDMGLAHFSLATGKGGYHRLYKLVTNERSELGIILADRFIYKLWEIFPDYPRLTELIQS